MRRPAFVLLMLSVFAAGAASLVYEVVWVRLMGLSLGSTAVATSVMLSAFLGGLALGSWIMGRRSDSLRSPLKTLFAIEIVAASLGALSVPALSWAGRAYVLIATATGGSSFVSLLLRAAFSLVVMLVPAMVFGATFPLTTAAAARLATVELAAGGVSAASCFGSAVGAAFAGLLLEPALGLTGSALVGAGLNVAAALIALVAAGPRAHSAAPTDATAVPSRQG